MTEWADAQGVHVQTACRWRRSARNRALEAPGCARQDFGPQAVWFQTCGAV